MATSFNDYAATNYSILGGRKNKILDNISINQSFFAVKHTTTHLS